MLGWRDVGNYFRKLGRVQFFGQIKIVTWMLKNKNFSNHNKFLYHYSSIRSVREVKKEVEFFDCTFVIISSSVRLDVSRNFMYVVFLSCNILLHNLLFCNYETGLCKF